MLAKKIKVIARRMATRPQQPQARFSVRSFSNLRKPHLSYSVKSRPFNCTYNGVATLNKISTTVTRRSLSSQSSDPNKHLAEKTTTDDDRLSVENFGSLSIVDKGRALVKIGKEFAVGAMTGVKQLWGELQQARLLRQELREAKRKMNRQVYLFLRKNRTDLRKLIPILLIWKFPIPFSGTIIPFLVFKYPHLLPSTFSFGKMPTMEQRLSLVALKRKMYMQDSLSEREQIIKRLVDSLPYPVTAASVTKGTFSSVAQYIEEPMQLANNQLRALLASVSNPAPGGGFLGLWTRQMLLNEWREHWEHILTDDNIMAEEGVDSLNELQLIDACLERGLKVLGLSAPQMRSQLSEWLQLTRTDDVTAQKLLIATHAFFDKDLEMQPLSSASVTGTEASTSTDDLLIPGRVDIARKQASM